MENTVMEFHIGLGEIITFVIALTSAGWALIKLSLLQFEKRLDEKLKTLDLAVTEIKRLEIEIIRNDAKAAQTYPTKIDHEKALERIFAIMERMETCLQVKISRDEVSKLMEQNHK